MNRNGFFTAIIALIIVVLLSTMLYVQGTAVKAKKMESNQRTIFELKTGMQNMQQLVDKSVSDAMSDCYNRLTCERIPECENAGPPVTVDYAVKVNSYMQTVIEATKETSGIDCVGETPVITVSNVSPGVDDALVNFDLVCKRSFSDGFSVEIRKPIMFDKEIKVAVVSVPPGPNFCTMQVLDKQSNTCDYLLNLAACTP